MHAKREREYDIVKLHSVYVQHVAKKETERIKAIINEKKKLMETEKSEHLRRRLKVDVEKLTEELKGDHLTNYLLETIPILNQYHSVCANLSAMNDKKSGDQAYQNRLEDLKREKSMIVSGYLRRFYPNLERSSSLSRQKHFVDHRVQLHCGVEPIQQDDCSVCCRVCGLILSQHEIDASNPSRNLSYNRNVSAASSFSYKRINHLRELLRQLQGKTTSQMPDQHFQRIIAEVDKQTLPRKMYTSFHIRKILKKLRLHRYYEQVVSLTKRINPSFEAIVIPPEYEEQLVFQFLQLEKPFEEVRSKIDKSRKNFCSYPFVFYRLNQLNGREDLNRDIRLLKSVSLVNRQDKLWKLVTQKLGWAYKGPTTAI